MSFWFCNKISKFLISALYYCHVLVLVLQVKVVFKVIRQSNHFYWVHFILHIEEEEYIHSTQLPCISLSCRCALCNYSTSLHSQLHSLGSYTSLYSQLNSLGSYTHSCCPRQHRICCRRLGSSHPLILFSLLTFSSFCCYISCAAVLPLFIGCNGYNGRPFQLTRLGFTCFYFRLMLLPIFLSLSAAPIMPTHSYFFLLFITLHTLHMSQLANVTPNTVKCRVPRLILFHFLVLMGLG
jgi:hypothetical protein